MSKKAYPKELEAWAEKLGTPLNEIQEEYDQELEKVTATHPEMDEKTAKHRAKVIMYSRVKSLLRSRAVAFTHIPIGLSGTRDMNTGKRNTLIDLYNDSQTRDEALAGLSEEGARVKVLINQQTGEETPIVVDTREYVEFETPEGQKRRFRNRGFGKELPILPVRDIVSIGKLSDDPEDTIKVLRISAMRESAAQAPKLGMGQKTRFTDRVETEFTRDLRTAAVTRYGVAAVLQGFEEVDLSKEEDMYNFLGTVPEWMQATIAELEDWHDAHADDFSRVVVVEGDLTFIGREPNATGNYLAVLEDESIMGLENEGITMFVPGDLETQIGFVEGTGIGSHVRVLARTSKGPTYDPDTREFDRENLRILLNVLNIVCDPALKVPYEIEEEAEEVSPEG